MPRKKSPGTAADPRNGERFALVLADGEPKIHLPAEIMDDLHPLVAAAYENYWYDPVSAILQQSDLILVQRYFTSLDRYFKLTAIGDKEPIVTGSQGQDAMNPCYSAANLALQEANRIERQLGIGPSNRSRLGIELIAADRAGAEGRSFQRGPDPDDFTITPMDDPREAGRDVDPRT